MNIDDLLNSDRVTEPALDNDLWPRRYQPVPAAYLDAELSKAITPGHQTYALLGSPGIGKTRQLWAMQQQQAKLRKRGFWIIKESEDIAGHMWDVDWLTAWKTWPHVLAVDDLGYRHQIDNAKVTDWLIQCAHVISDYRGERGLRTVWTSNLSKARIAEVYGKLIASRICSGWCEPLTGPDYRMESK